MSDETRRPDRKDKPEHRSERPARQHNGGNEGRRPAEKREWRGDRPQNRGRFNGNGGRSHDRPDGERKPFHSERPDGERRPFRGDRPDGERKPFRSERPDSERKPFHSDRPDGERRPFHSDRPDGERRPYRSDRPDGERRPFHSDRPDGERKPFRGDRPDGERRPFRGERPMGERRPFRGERPQHERQPLPMKTDGLPARRLALDVIREVTERGAYASLALNEKLEKCTLSDLDRRLAARLCYDTLDNLSLLDWALLQVMAKPDTDIKLLNILRLAACQILLEDRIPESAATNTAVNLCREIGLGELAGVCNGILRNLIRRNEEDPFMAPEKLAALPLHVRWSAPEWLCAALTEDWGEEAAARMLAVRASNSAIHIRRNLLRGDDAQFEELLSGKAWQSEPGRLPHTWRLRGVYNIGQDRDFTGGAFSIQSEGSMLACLAVDPQRGWRVLDACAAPGGKTCLMAEMMGGTGRVVAWELHPHRAELIEAQVRRLRLENVRVVARDALKPREELFGTMDAVLLDAPCTGTGDMAEKPDIKLRVKEENAAELVQTQAALLDAVSACVRAGGVLLYATCSVLKRENEAQIAAFLQRHPEFEIAPLPAAVPDAWRERYDCGLQLLPDRDGGLGFYLCRLRRKP